jgi:hypothetical protein
MQHIQRINERLSALEAAPRQQGCICPPTAEQTCQGLACPRRQQTQNDAPYLAGHKKAIDLFFRAMLEADRG